MSAEHTAEKNAPILSEAERKAIDRGIRRGLAYGSRHPNTIMAEVVGRHVIAALIDARTRVTPPGSSDQETHHPDCKNHGGIWVCDPRCPDPHGGVRCGYVTPPAELVAWFAENLSYDRFRDWSDEQFAAALTADRAVMAVLATRATPPAVTEDGDGS